MYSRPDVLNVKTFNKTLNKRGVKLAYNPLYTTSQRTSLQLYATPSLFLRFCHSRSAFQSLYRPYWPHPCSHDVSKTDMERQAPDTRHQALYIPDTCFVCVTVRRRHLDLTVRTLGPCHQKCLKQLLGIQWYDRVQNDEVLQRTFTVPSAIPSTHLGIWACGSTWWRHTSKHGSSAPHQRYQSTDLLTTRGVAHLVVHGTSGSTSY